MKIGFIGLGNMGAPMVKRLVASGHDITGYDVMESAMAALSEVKMSFSKDILTAAREQDVVITMLPNGEALIKVVEAIIPVMPKGSCFIDCSTVDINTTRQVATLLKNAAIHVLDAPVSGGVGGAEAGTLTFMVGGSEDSFAIGNPLFKIMGKRVIHCGADGAGQAAKICNNMILGVTMIATCEAFALADDLALDRQKLFDVVSTSSGNSWSMSTYCPASGVGPESPSDNDYLPGFSASLMLKDLMLSQEAATIHGTPTRTGQLALELYQDFVKSSKGGALDFSAILQSLTSRSKDQ
ncbi:3-hydroxyisobutyrate dehydrogenase [Alphaproteobacteria bacterium]|jgi:3-hydroxyisobutyrate dehydrogenase|nr:3-hydroxyisobutyrate dehydrogenase [Alphaproteobacteria bacterium]MDC0966878.1 3-hydroxyisobutyrate dehydrogenase [Alphaproteobacteria bacterium]MDC1156942.1 3-hydroxyisobutyrate dehydrogenase [Alphaproteobacteria bacterium]